MTVWPCTSCTQHGHCQAAASPKAACQECCNGVCALCLALGRSLLATSHAAGAAAGACGRSIAAGGGCAPGLGHRLSGLQVGLVVRIACNHHSWMRARARQPGRAAQPHGSHVQRHVAGVSTRGAASWCNIVADCCSTRPHKPTSVSAGSARESHLQRCVDCIVATTAFPRIATSP